MDALAGGLVAPPYHHIADVARSGDEVPVMLAVTDKWRILALLMALLRSPPDADLVLPRLTLRCLETFMARYGGATIAEHGPS
jgi:hypothetical protein